jgi:hypothetical protein
MLLELVGDGVAAEALAQLLPRGAVGAEGEWRKVWGSEHTSRCDAPKVILG